MRSASTGTSSNFSIHCQESHLLTMLQETKRLTACITDEHFRHILNVLSLQYLSWNFKHSVVVLHICICIIALQ